MRRRCAAALAVLGAVSEASNCLAQGFCNGHGTCVTDQDYCECYEGWGAKTDVATTRNHDCSQRTCPGGPAWADVPTEVDTAHALAECSAKGDCERVTGTCMCYPGFSGAACERYGCGNECSGHGKCLPMKRIAKLKDALPLSPGANTYTGKASTTRWDQDRIYGCVCDSSWDVGLLDGQRQEPEWFSHDCSLRHCPLGDDPYTPYVDETDCSNVTARYGHGVGETGNICQVDCANRGKCDYTSGECNCFTGSYGHDCTLLSALAL
ncbi:hypothetical protein M885DRAFT_510612 [Pelagophyceae sp. CCMP2097]|nr:hypothetical protein M885DRAFT_510612 [Pelagophyceae sp. CCMP2097]|mmetsp:Transcript_27087/g.96760  ORF Transcript_27087/g.96760 Transcript_27087/m.96760 type:complete len:266 (+) Transcript_27087:41-838(+)